MSRRIDRYVVAVRSGRRCKRHRREAHGSAAAGEGATQTCVPEPIHLVLRCVGVDAFVPPRRYRRQVPGFVYPITGYSTRMTARIALTFIWRSKNRRVPAEIALLQASTLRRLLRPSPRLRVISQSGLRTAPPTTLVADAQSGSVPSYALAATHPGMVLRNPLLLNRDSSEPFLQARLVEEAKADGCARVLLLESLATKSSIYRRLTVSSRVAIQSVDQHGSGDVHPADHRGVRDTVCPNASNARST